MNEHDHVDEGYLTVGQSCLGCGRELHTRQDIHEIHVDGHGHGGHGPFCAACAQSAEGLTFAEWLDNQWQRQQPH